MPPAFVFLITALAAVLSDETVRSQSNPRGLKEAKKIAESSGRRERQDPELIVESGGRLAYCDQMLFTADGKWVLCVGDDKVVRLWACKDGKLDPKSMRALRWNIWREFRGAIYSLALSPDREARQVAIGGVGEATTTVAVLDRTSGEIVYYGVPNVDRETGEVIPAGTPLTNRKIRNLFGVMSVAFAPSGKKIAIGTADGSVLVWDFKAFQLVGRHDPSFGGLPPPNTPPDLKDGFNRVRLVRFLDEDRLISAAESSEVVEWSLSASPAPRARQWVIGRGRPVRFATISPDLRWLAFALQGPVIAVRSIDGMTKHDVDLEEGRFPRTVAFDTTGKTLGAGVGFVPPGNPFYMETNDEVRLFEVGEKLTPKLIQPKKGRAESLAFHPAGQLLAVAGGNDHEVALWDLAKPDTPVSVMHGVGSCLWDVGLSKDGNVVGFKDHRNDTSVDPNNRGKGAWRAFHLKQRTWEPGEKFVPVQRLESPTGWQVKPDADDKYVWRVVSPGGVPYRLEHDGAREGMPRCYTFIEADADNPERLAVGHYWGLSIYELRPNGPKRVRLCVGHQGEVTALGLSSDRTWLVSSSNDQTIAAWSLSNRWPSQAILGAAFELHGATLRIKAVDPGSPAWEAGLLVGDEIILFAFASQLVQGGPPAWLRRLQDPVPGKEHYFRVMRDGKPLDMLTTARQRPLWRFFPTRDGEWVVWMWRNSFYDTSTNGDSYIGWHVNSPDPGKTPTFYSAEQLRDTYQNSSVIDKLFATRDVRAALTVFGDNPLPVRFDEKEPAGLTVSLVAIADGWEATLTATPRGDNPDQLPRRGELWVNDYLMKRWANVGNWEQDGRKYVLKVPIDASALRAGDNVLTFQTFSRVGSRAETTTAVKNARRAPAQPRLLGLAVGINDYKASKPPTGQRNYLVNLEYALSDAAAIKKVWEEQKYFRSTEIKSLSDRSADRTEILSALDELARKASPDDLCVIFLAGHGDFREDKNTKRSYFIFCCPRYEGNNAENTGVTSEVLYEKLAGINCRKLVLLDACHSGDAASSPVRSLTPGGQGPVILAACDRSQHSYENPKFGHGLFTRALLEALSDDFAKADTDGNKKLDTNELFNYTRTRLKQLLADLGRDELLQVPTRFAPKQPFTVTARE